MVLEWTAAGSTTSNQTEAQQPKVGGLIKTKDGTSIITCVGTDPDSQVNVFTYNTMDGKYTIDTTL
jgi:hypothetical protein